MTEKRVLEKNGFTMVEIVVMLAIITAISGAVLVNFSGLNEGGALNRSARELALNIRRAQNSSLAVTEIAAGDPPVKTISPAVGVELTRNQSAYFLFADLDSPTPRDYRYSGSYEKIGQDEIFQRNVKISSLTAPGGGTYSKVNLVFNAPEASLVIADSSGLSIGNTLLITLTAPTTGQTKTITVRTSGQISIQ